MAESKLETYWEPPKTIWNPMFLSIFFANMALNMGQQMSNSLLSLYANSLGAPADQIGQLMSMFAVTALIFRFISGPAMNAYNRRKLVGMAMSFMATAYLGFSFAPKIAPVIGVEAITIPAKTSDASEFITYFVREIFVFWYEIVQLLLG